MNVLKKILNSISYNTLIFLIVLSSFLIYWKISSILFQGYYYKKLFLIVIILILITSFFLGKNKLSSEVRIFLRLCSIFLLIYVASSSLTFLNLANPYFPLLAVCLSICLIFLIFKFDYFLIIPPILVLIYKNYSVDFYGLKISLTDYRVLIDSVVYPILLLSSTYIINKFFLKINIKKQLDFKYLQYLSIFIMYFVHLGNYFYSGLKKMSLTNDGGNLFSWLLHNETSNLITVTTITKHNPITLFFPSILSLDNFREPNFNQLVSIDEINLLINILTLIMQIGCIFFVTKHILNNFLILSFDISHILIFLFSGIFFYKWIFLNLFFLIFFLKFKHYDVFVKKSLILLVFTLLTSIKFFDVAPLAWYDGHFVKRNYLNVKFNDGKIYEMPKNIFLHLSITAEQGALIKKSEGNMVGGNIGSTESFNFYKKSFQCNVPKEYKINKQDKLIKEKKLQKVYLQNIKLIKKNNFYNKKISNTLFFPHHIWSNNGYFEYLDNYSFNDIDEIRLELKYVCLKDNKTYKIIDEISYLVFKNEI